MIIARLGSTWAGAYVLPRGMMIDDYGTDRPPIAGRVGGLDGEFDFLGDDANPIGPVRVKKTAIITATSWAGVETALAALRAALAGDESKLWGECRDGSHRWAWAKPVAIGDPDKVGQFLDCPIEIEWLLSEGLWYGETLHTLNVADASVTTINNAGNVPAVLIVSTSGGAGLSASSVNNNTNSSGWSLNLSATGVYSLTIDPGAYSVVQYLGSTDYYSLLTPNIPSRLWLTLNPGDNTIVTASTGGTSNGVGFSWYDTWVM